MTMFDVFERNLETHDMTFSLSVAPQLSGGMWIGSCAEKAPVHLCRDFFNLVHAAQAVHPKKLWPHLAAQRFFSIFWTDSAPLSHSDRTDPSHNPRPASKGRSEPGDTVPLGESIGERGVCRHTHRCVGVHRVGQVQKVSTSQQVVDRETNGAAVKVALS